MSDSSPQKKGGWGSVFSSAVSSLESRLDTILADDGDASASAKFRLSDIAEAKERAEQEADAARIASRKTLAPPASSASRDSRESSRSRVQERLAERLARATAVKKGADSSAAASRTESPAAGVNDIGSGRPSGEEKRSGEIARSVTSLPEPRASEDQSDMPQVFTETQDDRVPVDDTTQASAIPSRLSGESSTRPSIDDISSRPSSELPNGTSTAKTNAELEAELTQMRGEQAQRQEELHTYLEKIDALQAKLTYLAQQTVAAAKEANASASSDGSDVKLAEKDEQIAQLMQEGENLSKTELRHLQTIKKLRSKTAEDEKSALDTKKKLERVEQSEKDLRLKLRRSEAAERQASDKAKQIQAIEKQVDELKVDRENASELVRNLTVQLKEAKDAKDKAERDAKEKGSNEADKNRIATLENELEDAQIERKLAETKVDADVKQMKEDSAAAKQRFDIRELELKNEISILESRVEAMRSRAEEAASLESPVGGPASGAESNVKLLRQVETLQSQYALAKENWETIEGSLQARLAVLESERDESQRREGEARKKLREAGMKARKAEEEIESYGERVGRLEAEIAAKGEEANDLRDKLAAQDKNLADANLAMEQERKQWEAERTRWNRSVNGQPSMNAQQSQPLVNRNQSPATHSRKTSQGNVDPRRPHVTRLSSHDLSALHTDVAPPRPSSRRSSGYPNLGLQFSKPFSPSPPPGPPGLVRQESTFSAEMPPTPSIEVENHTGEDDGFDMMTETPIGMSNSPDRTINDIVSGIESLTRDFRASADLICLGINLHNTSRGT